MHLKNIKTLKLVNRNDFPKKAIKVTERPVRRIVRPTRTESDRFFAGAIRMRKTQNAEFFEMQFFDRRLAVAHRQQQQRFDGREFEPLRKHNGQVLAADHFEQSLRHQSVEPGQVLVVHDRGHGDVDRAPELPRRSRHILFQLLVGRVPRAVFEKVQKHQSSVSRRGAASERSMHARDFEILNQHTAFERGQLP